jgi:hypothetical protein
MLGNSDDFSDDLDEFEESQDDSNMKKKVCGEILTGISPISMMLDIVIEYRCFSTALRSQTSRINRMMRHMKSVKTNPWLRASTVEIR